jgi:hypothetical protein
MWLLRGVPVEGTEVTQQPIRLNTAKILNSPLSSECAVVHKPAIKVRMASLYDKLLPSYRQQSALDEEMVCGLIESTTGAVGMDCELSLSYVRRCQEEANVGLPQCDGGRHATVLYQTSTG